MVFGYDQRRKIVKKKDLTDIDVPVSLRNFLHSQNRKGNDISLYSGVLDRKYRGDCAEERTIQGIMEGKEHENRVFGLGNDNIEKNLRTSNAFYDIEDVLYFIELEYKVKVISFLDSLGIEGFGSQEESAARSLSSKIIKDTRNQICKEVKGGWCPHHFSPWVAHKRSESASPYVHFDINKEGVGLYYYTKFSSALLDFVSSSNKWIDKKRKEIRREIVSVVDNNEKHNL